MAAAQSQPLAELIDLIPLVDCLDQLLRRQVQIISTPMTMIPTSPTNALQPRSG
jgi:hypothetical protein